MEEIDRLEAFGHGPLRIRHDGSVITLPIPQDLRAQEILLLLEAGLAPNTPVGLTGYAATRLFQRWRAHHDLPPLDEVKRLIYLVNRYRAKIEVSLAQWYPGQQPLNELWAERRWRELLNLIDHLPRWSWYAEAISNDEEHARRLREAIAKRTKDDPDAPPGPEGPPLTMWTPEVQYLHPLLHAVRMVNHTLAQVNSKNRIEPPKPPPVPVTAIDRARKAGEFARRQATHEALAKRLLPHKR